MTDYQTARAALGTRLREVRLEAGLSGRALAGMLGWHPSKVSKLEGGRQTASVDDVTAWARACGNQDAAEELVAQRRALETLFISWRRQLSAGTRARQQASLDLEERTSRLRVFESVCVPGLLQTADYARHILRSVVWLHGTPNDVDEGVRSRMERRRMLDDPARAIEIVMWEPALRMRLCPATVMAGQLEHLAGVIARGRVRIGIVPAHIRLRTSPMHGFWIFDDDRVLVETVGAELSLTQNDAIRPYRRVFDRMSRDAVRGPAALRLVARVRRELAPDVTEAGIEGTGE